VTARRLRRAAGSRSDRSQRDLGVVRSCQVHDRRPRFATRRYGTDVVAKTVGSSASARARNAPGNQGRPPTRAMDGVPGAVGCEVRGPERQRQREVQGGAETGSGANSRPVLSALQPLVPLTVILLVFSFFCQSACVYAFGVPALVTVTASTAKHRQRAATAVKAAAGPAAGDSRNTSVGRQCPDCR